VAGRDVFSVSLLELRDGGASVGLHRWSRQIDKRDAPKSLDSPSSSCLCKG
jgi:hypothetical protein